MELESTFISCFNNLEDPRVDRTKLYPLLEIIFVDISIPNPANTATENWVRMRNIAGTLNLLKYGK